MKYRFSLQLKSEIFYLTFDKLGRTIFPCERDKCPKIDKNFDCNNLITMHIALTDFQNISNALLSVAQQNIHFRLIVEIKFS